MGGGERIVIAGGRRCGGELCWTVNSRKSFKTMPIQRSRGAAVGHRHSSLDISLEIHDQ